mgnify:CR=1 FL=1
MAAGRPTVLTQEMLDSALEYVSDSDSMGVDVLLPTIDRLAIMLDVSRDTLYQWEKDATEKDASVLLVEFSYILMKLRAVQADKLIQNGLTNRYNPAVTKMMLSKHGYVETKDITTGGDKLPAGVSAVDPIAAAAYTEYLKGK